MTNLLNQALNQQPAATSKIVPAFTFDAAGKVTPMQDKGHLLPSRVFGSPIQYAKDLKQDIVNIGRASRGNANDHELGRINDVATKIGSLAIAAYLCAKNPMKLDKAMQFVGFGSFFASMALLPKLLIQAPIKARTGVDIHQKYIDSQGRKKMLFQDPQYDLTDLYSREDLDRIGKKLKVSENLPDRDNFIKQRARKTATQGNTLWMMAAGASPILGALMSCFLEKGVNKGIEKGTIAVANNGVKNYIDKPTIVSRLINHSSKESFKNYLEKNADKKVDAKLAKDLAKRISKNINSATVQSEVEKEILAMGVPEILTLDFVKNSLKDRVPEKIFENLTEQQSQLLEQSINNKSLKGIADILSKATTSNKRQQTKLGKEFLSVLEQSKKYIDTPTLEEISKPLNNLNSRMIDFAYNKNILDRYISARIGDKSGTYIANQWGKFTNGALDALSLTSKELKALSKGDMGILEKKLQALAGNEKAYNTAMRNLMDMIGDYEAKTGSEFTRTIEDVSKDIYSKARKGFNNEGLHDLANRITISSRETAQDKIGTLENIVNVNAKERISGAQSSFYRFIQAMDVFKRANDKTLNEQIMKLLKEQSEFSAGKSMTESELTKSASRLVEVCKKVVLDASTVDYVEKLKSSGYELTEAEYKTVMKAIFDADSSSVVKEGLKKVQGSSVSGKEKLISFFKEPGKLNKIKNVLNPKKELSPEKIEEMAEGYRKYQKETVAKLGNWRNNITTELKSRVLNPEAVTHSANAVERNNLAGKPIKGMMQDAAKKAYNSKTWLKIWGGTFAVVAGITLLTGLFLGRKGKVEKEAEAQSKVNG